MTMTDKETKRVARDLGRYLRIMLKVLAEGHLKQIHWFQIRHLQSRFANPERSLRTLKALGLVELWMGNRKHHEPEGEVWGITLDGLNVHHELLKCGMYETRRKKKKSL